MDSDNPAPNPEPGLDGPAEPSDLAEPHASPTSPCSRCGTTEPPDATGLCPVKTCRCFRVGNTAAVIHDGRARLTPADFATRDALMDRLFRERGGRECLDIVAQLRVEDYATAQVQLGKVTRRLETLGAVSTAGNERKSLVATYTTFSARVERLAAELPPPATRTPTNLPGVERMPTSALELSQALLSRIVAGETLSEREIGRLEVLQSALHGELELPADRPDSVDAPEIRAYQSQADAETVEPGASSRAFSEPNPSQPASEPTWSGRGIEP